MKIKLLIIISLIFATLLAGGCKHEKQESEASTSKPKVSKLKDKAIEVATDAAKRLVETDHTDTIAMQNAVLDAKARQAEFQLADDSIAIATFNKTFKQYLQENDSTLAKEIFIERPKNLSSDEKWDEFEELVEDK